MKTKEIEIKLPEGTFKTNAISYNEDDRKKLANFYKQWRLLCIQCNKMASRTVNIPDGLSEGAFCLETGAVRIYESISGANTSFDAYNEKTKKRIQVKSCSVIPDLTSFGPRSVWDEIYFLDFYRDGEWDGSFDIYQLNNEDIYSERVNISQTLKNQQEEGRRPRLSLYTSIIIKKRVKPIKTAYLFTK